MDLLSPGLEPPPITRFDIEEAAERIREHVRRTPVLSLERNAFGVPGRMSLKLELLQHTGSFKARGAFSRMLSAELDDSGVLAPSGGNFGLAVAHAARVLGQRAEIFVPSTASPVKIEAIRATGAEVHVVPGYYADAYAACEERAFDTGAVFLHPYDQPAVVAGQGTIAMELGEQLQGIDTVLVPVGGGGLIGGVAAWFAGEVRVVGVEPEACPTLHAALAAGEPVDVEVGGIAADSLGARRVGELGFAIARRFVERAVLVSDETIAWAQRRLWEECRILAEPGGVASLAALLRGAYRPGPDEHVVCIISGGNTDPAQVA